MVSAAAFFTTVQPMEPLSKKVPFDNPTYYYEIKWDGVRILALIDQRRVILKSRRGNPRTGQYPELQRLVELTNVKNAVLDGEVVALLAGKPSFAQVLRRDLCRRQAAVGALLRQIPCTYCLFDLLYLNDTDLTGSPIEERRRLLQRVVQPAPPLYLNESFTGGKALYRAIKRADLEGVVAKKKGSPYRSGKKSTDWLKIKPRRRQLCVVGGLSMSGGSVSALLLGVYRNDELLYAGKAGSGLKSSDLLPLRDFALRETVTRSFFSNPPRGHDLLWLKPVLTVQIEFAEWTTSLKMRDPVVIGFSGCPPGEATI